MTKNIQIDNDLGDDVDPYIEKVSDILHNVDVNIVNRALVILLIDFCINYIKPDRREEWLADTTAILKEAIADGELHRDIAKAECSGNA